MTTIPKSAKRKNYENDEFEVKDNKKSRNHEFWSANIWNQSSADLFDLNSLGISEVELPYHSEQTDYEGSGQSTDFDSIDIQYSEEISYHSCTDDEKNTNEIGRSTTSFSDGGSRENGGWNSYEDSEYNGNADDDHDVDENGYLNDRSFNDNESVFFSTEHSYSAIHGFLRSSDKTSKSKIIDSNEVCILQIDKEIDSSNNRKEDFIPREPSTDHIEEICSIGYRNKNSYPAKVLLDHVEEIDFSQNNEDSTLDEYHSNSKSENEASFNDNESVFFSTEHSYSAIHGFLRSSDKTSKSKIIDSNEVCILQIDKEIDSSNNRKEDFIPREPSTDHIEEICSIGYRNKNSYPAKVLLDHVKGIDFSQNNEDSTLDEYHSSSKSENKASSDEQVVRKTLSIDDNIWNSQLEIFMPSTSKHGQIKHRNIYDKQKDLNKKPKGSTELRNLHLWTIKETNINYKEADNNLDGLGRVTRQLVKEVVQFPKKALEKKFLPGSLVWGKLSGWWPALVIKAEDAGMSTNEGKLWVCWIGELQISELNVKTQIEAFSNNLKERLENYLKNSNTRLKQKNHVCLATIKLLKKHFESGPLMKPYTTWLKHYVLPKKDKLNDILFYPYPDDINKKLREFKKMNCGPTKNYLEKMEKAKKAAETPEPKKAVKKKEEKEERLSEPGGIPIREQIPGVIAWAKISGYCWWPCVIMDHEKLNKKQANVAHQWVMWYGDFKLSQVEYRSIITFISGFKKMENKIKSTTDDLFHYAMVQATKDYIRQFGYEVGSWTTKDIIEKILHAKRNPYFENEKITVPYVDKYSPLILKHLREQIKEVDMNNQRFNQIKNSVELKQILDGRGQLQEICIICLRKDKPLKPHPYFHASLCEECSEDFKPKQFAYGNDCKCFYCSLCGGEDEVAICDNIDCPRVFCIGCIECIICPKLYKDILLEAPWSCFLCDPDTKFLANSLLKIRKDCKERLMNLYHQNCNDQPTAKFKGFQKRRMRVFSAFDGISTGYYVLEHLLNINIEKFYSSEIDPDCLSVSLENHGEKILQLGDIRAIDEETIKQICPIDLLIGGSPCNDLSLANPKRRGLNDPEGSGILFFEYVRIKKLIEKHNKNRHLFWLFENVASMPSKFRLQINDVLEREPQFLDAVNFSPQHRPRLYWSNLPWGPYEVVPSILQDVLSKNSQREALVKKVMTITTSTNSLTIGKNNLKPILVNGKRDVLRITELEAIFGLPKHYTDVDLPRTRRLRVIGKAWSVQTITQIFRPLKFFFLTTETNDC